MPTLNKTMNSGGIIFAKWPHWQTARWNPIRSRTPSHCLSKFAWAIQLIRGASSLKKAITSAQNNCTLLRFPHHQTFQLMATMILPLHSVEKLLIPSTNTKSSTRKTNKITLLFRLLQTNELTFLVRSPAQKALFLKCLIAAGTSHAQRLQAFVVWNWLKAALTFSAVNWEKQHSHWWLWHLPAQRPPFS